MAITKLYEKTGDEKAVEIQKQIEKAFGFIPETFQAMGRHGDFLESVTKLSEAAGKGLDPKTKELICIAVSAANGCAYCVEAHRALALRSGVTEEEITAAVEVASMMSMFNTYNKSIGLNHDIKADKG
ncbi:alkylhydroperoxidase AhpD family core domain protein [Limihaloglobus sulfuriphilus]|uniref:Alkylhydroperoxidase AhpD family core domain protein n=1 Tax=Limihaloglobus sulfuriphilus TaxID=1851148 RepID=A0A1Q2MB98_9BACT|nr:carboxymuconolactone decarboxylase family protein [Limihaloglobus sulfuriphilus]AQQ69966.1 alkylhydroperoxidase AhpD family core domain protein [Limihaloglobus sulfuriphilus]